MDREIARDKPTNVFRIVGLGDSFTFGYGVEVEDTYLAQLESLIRAAGQPVEVINLGVSGFGTAEQLIMLTEKGLAFDPDLVIVGYYINDIADTTRSGLFTLDDAGALIRKHLEYLPAVRLRDFLYSFALYRFLAENSHLLYFVRENLSELIQKRMRREAQVTNSLSDNDERRITAALLDEIKRICERRHIMFLLLDIPSAANQSNLPTEFLTQITEREVIDCRPAFASHMKTTLLYWQRSDGHWTPAAHRLAADLLFQRVQSPEQFPLRTPLHE